MNSCLLLYTPAHPKCSKIPKEDPMSDFYLLFPTPNVPDLCPFPSRQGWMTGKIIQMSSERKENCFWQPSLIFAYSSVPCPSRSRRTSRPPQHLPGCSQLTKFYPIAWHYCSLGTHLHLVLYTSIQPPLKHCKLHEIETVSFISSRHSRKILE